MEGVRTDMPLIWFKAWPSIGRSSSTVSFNQGIALFDFPTEDERGRVRLMNGIVSYISNLKHRYERSIDSQNAPGL